MAKINKYEDGSASIEFVSSKYIKVSCSQSNEITLGATAVCNGGTFCMFDALPLAFASTDGVDISLKASAEVSISKTRFKKTKEKGEIKTIAVSSCKNEIETCAQKITTIQENTMILTSHNTVYGKKKDLGAQLSQIESTRQQIADKANSSNLAHKESIRKENCLAVQVKAQIAQMNETVAQLKKIQTQLSEIIRQKTAVGTSNSEQGGAFSSSSGMLSL